jgi:hypothetical protein
VAPSFVAIALVVAGVWVVFTDELDGRTALRVLEWSVAGMAGVGALGGLALFLQREGYVIDRPVFVLTSTVVTGALAGFGIGAYEVWSQRRTRELEREREKMDHLNRLLRHHLLNGMNVLLAKVDLARERTGESQVAADLEDAHVRGQEIVTLVEQVSAIAGADENDAEEVDLARLLRGEAERLRATCGEEAVSLAEPLPEVTVRSSRTLGEAVSVLLDDALAAGGGRATVSAALDGDEAVVSVSAPDGPAADGGEPTERASSVGADGGERLLGGPGSDVGLSVADVLVERAGGDLEAAEAERTVRIRLETAPV